jgi:hypothetical protein
VSSTIDRRISFSSIVFFIYTYLNSIITVRSYEGILTKFGLMFGDRELEEISSEDILTFLSKITDGRKQHDIAGQKLLIRDPKSGREQEVIFITQKIADRLREYTNSKHIEFNRRIFPISYEAARSMVKKVNGGRHGNNMI